jgi:hypothetical protein
MFEMWPPLWSTGQSSWLLIQRSLFRFPALRDFLSSSGSGMGSTYPRDDKWGATWKRSLRSRKLRLIAMGDPSRWPCDIPLSTKVDTKFRRQVSVDQSVWFACGLKATELVCPSPKDFTAGSLFIVKFVGGTVCIEWGWLTEHDPFLRTQCLQ